MIKIQKSQLHEEFCLGCELDKNTIDCLTKQRNELENRYDRLDSKSDKKDLFNLICGFDWSLRLVGYEFVDEPSPKVGCVE